MAGKKTGPMVDIEVNIAGRLFTQGPEIIRDNIRDAIAEIVQVGEAEAKTLASPFRKTGRYMASLKGKVAKTGRSGRIKAYGGPKKMPYSKVHELGRYFESSGTRIKGHFVLKNTRMRLNQQIGPPIFAKHMNAAVQELNN